MFYLSARTAPKGTEMLRSIITPKGSTQHLVKVGEQFTLCGRHHGLNPAYTGAEFMYTGGPEDANCGKCKKLRKI